MGADAGDSELESPAIPEVLTPVRLKQPRTEVPASVTVIDHEMIKATGVREIPEVLRLVPGMVASARSGWDYVVSYHGTNRRNSRRMQVLIDGRSIYQAGLATIEWTDIPLAIEDIERIEVTRGPDTAAYGANAFLGIVNIITKHPDDSARARVRATYGTHGTENYYASTSGNLPDSSYRLTAVRRRDNGFDRRDAGDIRHDTKSLHLLNGRWLYAPAEAWNLGAQFGYKNGLKTDDTNPPQLSPPDVHLKDYFASVHSQLFLSQTHSLKWQLDYSHTDYGIEYRTCDDFGITLCGDIDENSENTRIDFDLQDTWIRDNWKLVAGTHLQRKRAQSETFYDGTIARNSYQLFASFEYRFSPQWATTLGGSEERQQKTGSDFSPRAALLFSPSRSHTFRLVYSEAIRRPDFYENNLVWGYRARNVAPLLPIPVEVPDEVLVPVKTARGDLHEEHIRSREFGYYGLWFNGVLELDAKIFDDDLTDLISESLANTELDLSNGTALNQTGFETEINLRPTQQLRLHASYAQINSEASTTTFYLNPRNEMSLTPRQSGSAGIVYSATDTLTLSTFHYFANKINNIRLSRWDFRVAKQLRLGSAALELSTGVQHYFGRYSDYFRDNMYDTPNRLYVSADMSF